MKHYIRSAALRVALLILLALCMAGLAGCTFSVSFGEKEHVQLSDKYISETVALKGGAQSYKIVIDKLILSNSDITVRIQPSDNPRVEALYSESLKQYGFAIAEEEDVLTISTGHNYTYSTERFELNIYANFHALSLKGSFPLEVDASGMRELAISVSGATRCRMSNITADRVGVDIAGAASVEMQGYTDELVVSLSGAGNIDAKYLACREASVELAGAGNVNVSVSELLKVDIAGVGAVRYYGSPAVRRSIAGLGSVEQVSSTMMTQDGYI